MIITAAQVHEARKLASLTLPTLGAQCGVDAKHLDAFERGKRRMSMLDLSVIQRALESAGIEFVGGHAPTVKMKAANPNDTDALPDNIAGGNDGRARI
jgi:transcriptional regulator with XRE-family HTH domain